METLKAVEFNKSISSHEALEAVQSEGAIAIHNFLPPSLLAEVSRELREEQMYSKYVQGENKVNEKQDMSRYGFAHGQSWLAPTPKMQRPPKYIHDTAQFISDYVNSAEGISWKPNEIMGHRYKAGDYLEGHRDYERAVGYVAVVTAEGMQHFYFDRDNGEREVVYMEPGTLTLMRGNQEGKERPYHGVEVAKTRRLAISLRQMTDFNRLKTWD